MTNKHFQFWSVEVQALHSNLKVYYLSFACAKGIELSNAISVSSRYFEAFFIATFFPQVLDFHVFFFLAIEITRLQQIVSRENVKVSFKNVLR